MIAFGGEGSNLKTGDLGQVVGLSVRSVPRRRRRQFLAAVRESDRIASWISNLLSQHPPLPISDVYDRLDLVAVRLGQHSDVSMAEQIGNVL
jgi:hypothetical protein